MHQREMMDLHSIPRVGDTKLVAQKALLPQVPKYEGSSQGEWRWVSTGVTFGDRTEYELIIVTGEAIRREQQRVSLNFVNERDRERNLY